MGLPALNNFASRRYNLTRTVRECHSPPKKTVSVHFSVRLLWPQERCQPFSGLLARWLVDNFQSDFGGQPFQGRSLESYDAAK
jgi:hypothetical protein